MKLFRLSIAISVLSFFVGCGGAPSEESGSSTSETRASSSSSSQAPVIEKSSSSKSMSSVKSSSSSSSKSNSESSEKSSTASYQRSSRAASSTSDSSLSGSSSSSDGSVLVFKPTIPGKPEASVISPRSILLSWQPSQSSAGITAYLIYRNGFNIATVDGSITQYENTFLVPEETYTYYIMARDANNSLSLQGEPNTFTTPKEANSSSSKSSAAPSSTSSSSSSTLSSSSRFSSPVSSLASSRSSSSATSVSSTASSAKDTIAPTKPTNLQNQNATETSISIKWAASTDSVGVVKYEVLRDGVNIASLSSTTLTHNDTGLTARTIYKYKVSAFDAAGNFSTSDEELVTSTKAMPNTTMTLTWNHPTARENGEALSIEEIGGYEIRYKLPSDTLFTYIKIPGNATTMYIAPRAMMDTALIEIATYDINGLYSRFVELKPDI